MRCMYVLRELADEILRTREARRESILECPCEIDVTVVRARLTGHLYQIRHSQLKGEEEEAARGIVVNENASVWRTSAEIDVKGK